MKQRNLTILGAAALAMVLGGCGERAAIDPQQQTGAAPVMPAAKNFLVPPMQVPRASAGRTMRVPRWRAA